MPQSGPQDNAAFHTEQHGLEPVNRATDEEEDALSQFIDSAYEGSWDDDRGHHYNESKSSSTRRYQETAAANQLHLDMRTLSNESTESHATYKTPKAQTPGSKLTSFFGWNKAVSSDSESTATDFSDKSHSPLTSPQPHAHQDSTSSQRSVLAAIDVPKANAAVNMISLFSRNEAPKIESPPADPEPPSAKFMALEDELREISSELAASIRREMDLEDMIEQLQSEGSQTLDPNRRTSDYFSDSGTSSVRYPLSDAGKGDDLEKLKRRSEQEKAQLKADVSQKVQDERARRKVLEAYVKTLEGQVQSVRASEELSMFIY